MEKSGKKMENGSSLGGKSVGPSSYVARLSSGSKGGFGSYYPPRECLGVPSSQLGNNKFNALADGALEKVEEIPTNVQINSKKEPPLVKILDVEETKRNLDKKEDNKYEKKDM